MKLDLSSLEDVIIQLKEALDLCDSEIARSNPLYKRHLRAGAIKAFEYTYEISIKMIIRYMDLTSASPTEIKQMSFNNLIREAYGKNLIRSDLESWCEYHKKRGTTSHAYNAGKAQEIFESTPDFLDESRYLLGQLQERNKLLG